MYICIYVYMYICIYVYVYICIYVYGHVYIHIGTIHRHDVCMYMCTLVLIYIYIHIYTCMQYNKVRFQGFEQRLCEENWGSGLCTHELGRRQPQNPTP